MANEKRLIDCEQAKRATYEEVFWTESEQAVVRNFLARLPKVDAVEVVHGEWEIIEDDYFDLVETKCSVCGESYGFEDYEDDTPKHYHYCPNCGAKMDGDGNG